MSWRRVGVFVIEALLVNELRSCSRCLQIFELLNRRQRLLGAELAVGVVVVFVVVNAVGCGHQVPLRVVEVCPDGDLGANGILLRGQGMDGLVCLHRID